jgi:hypothetical protein
MKNEAEGDNALCAACDRDQWKEATIRSNKRFQRAEDLLKSMHHQTGKYAVENKLAMNYPASHAELINLYARLNEGTQ